MRDQKPTINFVTAVGLSGTNTNNYNYYEDVCGHQSWQQLIVPPPLRDEIMQALHSSVLEGHLGVDMAIAKIKE